MNPNFVILLLFAIVQAELRGKLRNLVASLPSLRKTPSGSGSFSGGPVKPLVVPESSDNPEVLEVKRFRERFDKLVAAVLDVPPQAPVVAIPCLLGGCPKTKSLLDTKPAYPEAKLSQPCLNAIAKAYQRPMIGDDFKAQVLQVLGRGAAAMKVIDEAVATLAANLTASYGLEAAKILLTTSRKIFAGFGQDPVNEEDYEEMRDEAIRLLGKDDEVIALANSEEMTRSLRSMGFSSCANLESLSNLIALLMKFTNFQNLSRTVNKEVWTAVFATILKLTLEARKNGEPQPEQQAFLLFYKKGRFAEVYSKLSKNVDFRKTYRKSFFD